MPPAHISHLPQEISDITIDHLATDIYFDDYNVFIGQEAVRKPTREITTFQHYSLISRQFTARVQKHLFHVITIHHRPSLIGLIEILKLKGFLHDALKHITVDEGILFNAGFIKILNDRKGNCPTSPLTLRVFANFPQSQEIYYKDVIKARSDPESLCGLQAVETLHCGQGTLGEFIRDFHWVKTLHLEDVKFPRGHPVNGVGSPWVFPHLKKLVFYGVEDRVGIDFMTGCVNLETLVVDYSNIGEYIPDPTANVRLPRIKNLAFGHASFDSLLNVVDISQLRVYEDRYRYPRDVSDYNALFADTYFTNMCTVLRTCCETLESFHIGALLTSAFGEGRQPFNLASMTKLSALIMDFEVSHYADTAVDYILDTIRTLDPRSVEQGIIKVKIRFRGDEKELLVKVFEQDEWPAIKQELIRLSQIAPTELNVHVNVAPDDEEYQRCLEAVDEWCLSLPDVNNVSVNVEMKSLLFEDYQL